MPPLSFRACSFARCGADGYVEQLNSVAIINARDVLVFDTTTRPSTARQILAELRRRTDKPVRYVVNSHWHPDHWSGNEVFAEAFPDADIIATDEARAFMENAAPAWPARFRSILEQKVARHDADVPLYRDFADEAARVRRTLPTTTYTDHLTLRHGGREFQLFSLQGDANGTTVLYLPAERIACVGDLMVLPIPYGSSSPSRMLRDLKRLRALAPAIIVPGHGPVQRDMRMLDAEIAVLDEVHTQVVAALRKGAATLAEVTAAVDVGSLRPAFTGNDSTLDTAFRQWVQGLISRTIREAREQDYS